jgi:CTP synthase (UTP-ammonia lyase)
MIPLVKIGIIGDFDETKPSHAATNEALRHCSEHLSIHIEAAWLPTEGLEGDTVKELCKYDALWCAPGSPYKSFAGAINGIRYARERGCPFIGTCGGFQHAVLEYAINVLGINDAGHQELDPSASTMVITALPCPIRLESRSIRLRKGTQVRDIYEQDVIEERYNCSFGLSPEYRAAFESSGFIVAGTDENEDVRILEMLKKRFFVTTLFQPQLTSRTENPHKLILAYLNEAKKYHDRREDM